LLIRGQAVRKIMSRRHTAVTIHTSTEEAVLIISAPLNNKATHFFF
jgi:hypothetical protein